MSEGKLIIISAPSGTGKGTIISLLTAQSNRFWVSVSATTRDPRGQEQNGVEYHFLSREAFEDMIENHELLEYAEYSGNYYGTPLLPLMAARRAGKDVILEIEVNGFLQVKELAPDAVSIFIQPPSLEELERRLRGRGTDSEEAIQKRLRRASEELLMSDQFDYVVVNDVAQRAADEIIEIITKQE
ncbi:MAG: guanylate kinase [Oscillospiraceae bacterium]|nr:guanylate kinase [Oscillospiraceae bacterium]